LTTGTIRGHRALQQKPASLAGFGTPLLEQRTKNRIDHILKDRLDRARVSTRADRSAVRTLPEKQSQGSDEHAFSGTRLTGNRREAGARLPEEILDESKVPDTHGSERCGHGKEYVSVTASNKAMRDLDVTFLGTGTSHGIPVIGCQCRVCSSSDPRDKRLRTAAILRTGEAVLQIDTPPDFRTQCLREAITRIDAVIYTHSHTDHILGFDDLRRFCELEKKNMPIYAAPRTLTDLKRVFAYAFGEEEPPLNYVRPSAVPVEGAFPLGGLDILPVDLPHGRMVTTGLVFSSGGHRKLAYFTDCQAVPPAAEEAARGVDVLVLDALRHASHSTHMSLSEAIEAAHRIRARRTYLIHMCHDLGHAETERNLPDGIRLAYDGLQISI